MGVGFLITNLHFATSASKIWISDILAQIIGLSIFIGIVFLISATLSYFIKARNINRQNFTFLKRGGIVINYIFNFRIFDIWCLLFICMESTLMLFEEITNGYT